MPSQRIIDLGGKVAEAIEAVIRRESLDDVELCEFAEQVIVNGGSLLLTAFLGKHKPGFIKPVVHAGLTAMVAEVRKIQERN